MNEPKKRGRPSKAEIAARNAQVEGADVAILGPNDPSPHLSPVMPHVWVVDEPSRAQAYADRVWAGQSESADRPWRIQRVKEALEGQGLSFEGVVLP